LEVHAPLQEDCTLLEMLEQSCSWSLVLPSKLHIQSALPCPFALTFQPSLTLIQHTFLFHAGSAQHLSPLARACIHQQQPLPISISAAPTSLRGKTSIHGAADAPFLFSPFHSLEMLCAASSLLLAAWIAGTTPAAQGAAVLEPAFVVFRFLPRRLRKAEGIVC